MGPCSLSDFPHSLSTPSIIYAEYVVRNATPVQCQRDKKRGKMRSTSEHTSIMSTSFFDFRGKVQARATFSQRMQLQPKCQLSIITYRRLPVAACVLEQWLFHVERRRLLGDLRGGGGGGGGGAELLGALLLEGPSSGDGVPRRRWWRQRPQR